MLENTLLFALQGQNQDPDPIMDWIKSKKLSIQHLPFLNLLKTDLEKKRVSEIFLQCLELNASLSDTIQILELVTELVLINPNHAVIDNPKDIQSWKVKLKNLRYPQTMQSDQDLKKKLEALSWPPSAKIKFERRGDRAGVELKLFITSSADLIKAISALERVKEQI